LSISYLVKLSK